MAKCTTCDGKGEIACIQCYGSGRHGNYPNPKECAYCKGTKKQICPECRGSGKSKK